MKKCLRCNSGFQSIHKYCPACREQIMAYLKNGESISFISNKMGIKWHTVVYYQTILRREQEKTMLLPDHQWFPYKQKLESMLAELSEETGIKDWNSKEGQNVLEYINLQNEAEIVNSKDTYYEVYGLRHGNEDVR